MKKGADFKMFLKERFYIFIVVNDVQMNTIVTRATINNRLKKKYQIALRRLMLGQAPSAKIREWVGLDYLQLKGWLSSRMLPGMTWNNYGEEWNIAHLVNLIHFDLSKEDDCRLAWNYRNLMPLFSKDVVLKENDLGFSEMLLRCLEPCPIVDKLKEIVEREMTLLYERYGFDRKKEQEQCQKAI
jgi:hypothetical protein